MTTKELLEQIASNCGGTYKEPQTGALGPNGSSIIITTLVLGTKEAIAERHHECRQEDYDPVRYDRDVEGCRILLLIEIGIHGIKKIEADQKGRHVKPVDPAIFSSQGLDVAGHPGAQRNPYGIFNDMEFRLPIYIDPGVKKSKEIALDAAIAIMPRTTEVHFGKQKIGATAADSLIEDAKKIEAYLNGNVGMNPLDGHLVGMIGAKKEDKA